MSHDADIEKQQQAVHAKSEHIESQISTLEKFIARRFDEISMEINATSQQVDMAEEGITSKFSEIMEVIQAISYSGGGLTPANAGVELDAVVDMTEDAANKILDSAGRITSVISKDTDWSDENTRKQAFESIQTDVDEIFMACSFQDITSQRIKKTLDNLRVIEDRLGGVLDKLGIKALAPEDNPQLNQQTQSQDDIDALFDDARASGTNGGA